MSAANRCRAYT